MRCLHICYALLIIALVTSCTKEPVDNPNELPPVIDTCDYIVEVQQYQPFSSDWSTLFKLEYDRGGRLEIMRSAIALRMQYLDNKIVQSWVDGLGNYNSIEYYLNEQGFIMGDNTFDYQYTYNADGYMMSYRQPYSNGAGGASGYHTWEMRYENDNLVEATTSGNVSIPVIKINYFDEPNQDLAGFNSALAVVGAVGTNIRFVLIKGGFYGRQSKNLLKSIDLGPNYPSSPIQYAKDGHGRITQMAGDYQFTYQCP